MIKFRSSKLARGQDICRSSVDKNTLCQISYNRNFFIKRLDNCFKSLIFKVGGYGIGDNGPATYYPSNGFTSPYNLAIFKNFGAERMARTHSWSHQAMSMWVLVLKFKN